MTCPECEYYKTYYEPDEHFGMPCYREVQDCSLGRDEGECEEGRR